MGNIKLGCRLILINACYRRFILPASVSCGLPESELETGIFVQADGMMSGEMRIQNRTRQVP